MKREIFSLEIYTTGKATLFIRTPADRDQDTCGRELNTEPTDPAIFTPQILSMLAEAYYTGYETAVFDARESVEKLMRENKSPRRPSAKISQTTDYRRIEK
jgi:hypothetical protein